jgi:voltage-gated potassium channel
MPRLSRWRRRIGTWFSRVALAIGLLAVVLITDDDIRAGAHGGLEIVLGFCVAVFAVELGFRLHDAYESHHARRYLWSAYGIADLLGVIAIPLAFAFGLRGPDAWLFGALWILKITPAASGLRQLGRVIVAEHRPLATVATLFLIALTMGAIALHELERDVQSSFDSLPKSLWWAVTTLTTTGYGDVVPQTPAGRMVAGSMMVAGICVFALFAGILATGFAAEGRREDFLRNLALVRRVPFLRVLGAPGIGELARMLRRLEVPERATIFRRGDAGDCMFFIVSGEVAIDVGPEPVLLGAGNFFGEMALLSGRTRNATAIAARPSTLLMLEAMDFHTLTGHHPELAKAVEEEARRRHSSNDPEL